MKIIAAVLILACAAFAQGAPATQSNLSADDIAAIKAAAMDYAESYYEGDPARMERALHPELAKRTVATAPDGGNRLGQMSAMTLVGLIRTGSGKSTPKDQQTKNFTLLDSWGNMAMAKLEMKDWVDYMQLARWNGGWKIVNVLWEPKPKK